MVRRKPRKKKQSDVPRQDEDAQKLEKVRNELLETIAGFKPKEEPAKDEEDNKAAEHKDEKEEDSDAVLYGNPKPAAYRIMFGHKCTVKRGCHAAREMPSAYGEPGSSSLLASFTNRCAALLSLLKPRAQGAACSLTALSNSPPCTPLPLVPSTVCVPLASS